MKEELKVKGIPSSEKEWTIHFTKDDRVFITTSNRDRSTYYLYEVIDGVATKLGKAASPKTLEEKFIKWE